MEIGIDIVSILRFKGISKNKALLKKIFTSKEITYCARYKDSASHFAVRFAGKEAIIKSLSPYKIALPMNKIEILNHKNGLPYVKLLRKINKNLKIKISLSHCKNYAVAQALIIES